MAPLPKRRHSTARSGKRRKSRTLGRVLLINCPSCGQPKKPHEICPSCGKYNNQVILQKKKKKESKESK